MANQGETKFKFPVRDYDPDDQFSAKLCHIETPDSFYITLFENNDLYNELFDELTRVYSHCLKEKSIKPLSGPIDVGDHCIYHQDPFFLRGEVFAVKDNGKVDMLDLDTGEINRSVSKRSLFPVIKNSFIRQTPVLAPHCKLPDIVPLRASHWDEETLKYIVENYSERGLTAQFIGREGDLYHVSLCMKSGREVVDHMIAIGLARRPKRSIPLCHLPKLDFNPSVGDFVNIIVSHVESPAAFFVQLACNEDLISKLAREMNREYPLNPDKYAKKNLTKGEFCAAKYRVDGRWYRALITARLSPTTVEVKFVDYGNKERVPTKDLRQLKSDFSRYPPQAVECCLSGVRCMPVISKSFIRVAEGQRMIIHVEDIDYDRDVLTVTLLQNIGSQQYNINECLAGRAQGPPLPERPIIGVAPCPYPDNEFDLGSDDEDQYPGPSASGVQSSGPRYVGRRPSGSGAPRRRPRPQ